MLLKNQILRDSLLKMMNTHGSTCEGYVPSFTVRLYRRFNGRCCLITKMKQRTDQGHLRSIVLPPSSRLAGECLCFCSCAVIQKWREPGSLFGQPMGKASLCSALWELKHWFYRQDHKSQKKREHKFLILGRFTPGVQWWRGPKSKEWVKK